MKKITLALLCAGIAASATAQEKSIFVFGNIGGINAQSENSSGQKGVNNVFVATPGIGYQFSPNWIIGVEGLFDYSGSHTKPSAGNKRSTIGLGGGIFSRYTLPLTNIFYFYTQGDILYSSRKAYDSSGSVVPNSTSERIELKVIPGIGLNIKHGFALNFGFGSIALHRASNPGGNKTYGVGYNLTNAFSFGLTKNFVHKKPSIKNTEYEIQKNG